MIFENFAIKLSDHLRLIKNAGQSTLQAYRKTVNGAMGNSN